MNDIQVFSNEQFGEIRTVQIDGEPWLVGKDVASILGYTNPQKAIRNHVDEEDKTVNDSFTVNGTRAILINESGLYSLVLSSKLPTAKQFKRWVTHEVLPSIRTTGMYIAGQETNEMLMARALIVAQDTMQRYEKRIGALESRIEADAPKVQLAEALETSDQCILVGQLAKILRQNGVETGQQRLFKQLRQDGYLCKVHGERFNMPTQRYMEQGLFQVKERSMPNPDGSTRITFTTVVTPKGQRVLINRYMADVDGNTASNALEILTKRKMRKAN